MTNYARCTTSFAVGVFVVLAACRTSPSTGENLPAIESKDGESDSGVPDKEGAKSGTGKTPDDGGEASSSTGDGEPKGGSDAPPADGDAAMGDDGDDGKGDSGGSPANAGDSDGGTSDGGPGAVMGDDGPACGDDGQACCEDDACEGSLACVDAVCRPSTSGGGGEERVTDPDACDLVGDPCCELPGVLALTGIRYCAGNLVCSDEEHCREPRLGQSDEINININVNSCNDEGEACCSVGDALRFCLGGLQCTEGRCGQDERSRLDIGEILSPCDEPGEACCEIAVFNDVCRGDLTCSDGVCVEDP